LTASWPTGEAPWPMVSPASAIPSLVARCQSGDEAAFGQLYREHRETVSRLVYRVLGPTAELEDVVQEVFLQVHRSIGRFRGQSQFSTWLHRVTVNVALQQIRRRRSQPIAYVTDPVELPEGTEDETPLDRALMGERLAAVYRVLERLSPKKRIVLVLHDLESVPAAEIAKIVGSNVLTVRTRLFYARREFQDALAKEPAFRGTPVAP
jgi:RNA polymerase sigma-70 factor, ECF subfamily